MGQTGSNISVKQIEEKKIGGDYFV